MAVIWMGTGRFGVTYDADAQAYITAVEAADAAAGQSGGLEVGVKDAINAFVVGCKADGIWSAIKASCILAGARTLDGCLVPLAGTAPTNFNFAAGDYNRKTGLVGNGSTKYLNSNRNRNADPQNSQHIAAYRTVVESQSAARVLMGAGVTSGETGATHIRLGGGTNYIRHTSSSANIISSPLTAGLVGASRNSSSTYSALIVGTNFTFTQNSQTPVNAGVFVFCSSNILALSDARLAFYSIGEALDLALLDARVTTLINAIAAAIP
jgi:hypothetical protein